MTQSRRQLKVLAAGPWSLAVAAYALAHITLLTFAEGEIVRLLTIIAFLPYNGILVWLGWRLVRHYAAVPAARRTFAFMLGSILMTVGGSIGWIYLENFLGTSPEFSWVNLLYMLSYLFAILCIRGVTGGLQRSGDRQAFLLDNLMLVTGCGILIWYLIIVPLAKLQLGWAERIVVIGFPLMQFCVFIALVPLVLRCTTARVHPAVRVYTAGWALVIISDFAFQLTTELSDTVFGLTPLAWNDIVYCLSYLTLVAGSEQLLRLPPAERWSHEQPGRPVPYWSPVPLLITGLVYLMLILIGAQRELGPIHDLVFAWVLMTGLTVLSEVVATRQYAALLHSHSEREADARFWSVVRELNVGIVLHGPDTEVQTCNPRALEMLGLGEAEYLGKRVFEESWQALREDESPFPFAEFPLVRAIATGQPVHNVIMGVPRRNDRRLVWMMVNADPKHDDTGRLQGVTITLLDISDRQLLESQLRQSQRMEAIGQLAGGIAHNFNNLLTVIIGYADLLKTQLERLQQRTDYADQILAASQRTSGLAQQLLAFGRRQMLQSTVLDVNEVTADMGRMLAPLLGERIIVKVHLATEKLRVRVDRAQLEQVLLNMSLNARDAMPDGGELVLGTRSEPGIPGDADAPPSPDRVCITITDTGTGMQPQVRERIFEPFFTTRDISTGGGLGLSVAYGIVKQSGGEIEVQSTFGLGSSFRILLPRAAPG